MTTIAASRTQIAGDRQATHSGGMKFKIKTKILTFHSSIYPVPFHVGLCGNLENFPEICNYFQYPEEYKKPPKITGTEGVVLTEKGELFMFFKPGMWMKLDQPFYAVGSGMHFAMGAMEQGASPYEAVKAASKLDPNTGMGVTKIELEK